MSRLKEISKQQDIDVYIHINDNLSFLKSILEQNGLRKIDKLTGLVNVIKGQKFLSKNESKKQEPVVNEETCRVVRSVDEFEGWLDVYSTSF